MESRRSIFGTLKNKLTRKDLNAASISRQRSLKSDLIASQPTSNQNNNGFGSASPATRRPDRSGMNAFSTPSNEPPPAYTPAPQPGSVPSPSSNPVGSAPVAAATNPPADDPYAFLSSFDTVFLVDDSGSMAGSRWEETDLALQAITPICTAHDADGIDIYFLNEDDKPFYRNVNLPGTVAEIFQSVLPSGGTPTGQRLHNILKPYLKRLEKNPDTTKPLNIIVITDGEPSDDVESTIIAAAKKLDKLDAPAWQVGIQFFQVGREPAAKAHLKQLDDELAELAGQDDLRDIVDTVPFKGKEGTQLTGDGILKVVLGSVVKRLDRKKSKDLHR